jgi:hypothetical protein
MLNMEVLLPCIGILSSDPKYYKYSPKVVSNLYRGRVKLCAR